VIALTFSSSSSGAGLPAVQAWATLPSGPTTKTAGREEYPWRLSPSSTPHWALVTLA
jgi:hypothetical protein